MAFVNEALAAAVGRIEVRSAFGPNIDLDDPFGGPSGAPLPLGVRLLRPKITLYDTAGQELTTVAPAGEPGVTAWPAIVIGLGVLLAMAARGAYR